MRNTFKSTVLAATVLTGLMAISPGAKANIFTPGDLVVGNYNSGSGNYNIADYLPSSSGALVLNQNVYLGTFESAMASTSTSIIYGNFNSDIVYSINQSGVISTLNTVSGYVSGIQTDANNNIFVSESGGYGSYNIYLTELSSTGTVLSTKSFTLPSAGGTTGTTTFTTLSSNESTLYVHNNGNVYGINVSTGATTELYYYNSSVGSPMVVLPNGNLLFSNSVNEIQLNPNTGTVVSSTPVLNGADSGLAVDTSNSFVYGTHGGSYNITYASLNNLSSVSTLNTTNIGYTSAATVFGQYSLGTQTSSQTPAPEPASAVLLVGMLGMLVAAKYRRARSS